MINPFTERLAFQLASHDIAATYSQDLANIFLETADIFHVANLEEFNDADLNMILRAIRDLLETKLLRREAEEALERYVARVRRHLGEY